MKLIFLSLLFPSILFANSLLEQPIKDNSKFTLNQFKGKSILLVNIATQCGYTGQLSGLEKLHAKYKSKNFTVIGVPSNDFGGQTPEDDKGVKKFCKLNYGVTFPLAPKVSVKGDSKSKFFKQLLAQSSDKSEIGWNFEKFLLNKEGKVIRRFKSSVSPESKELIESIEKLTDS